MARTPGSKLSDAQIIEIFLSTDLQKIAAAKFGVSRSMVCAIRKGRYRPDVTFGIAARVVNASLITAAFVGAP